MPPCYDPPLISRRISYRTGTNLSRTLYLTHLYFYHKNVGEMGVPGVVEVLKSVFVNYAGASRTIDVLLYSLLP